MNSTVTLCLTVLDTSCWLKLTSLNVRIFGCVMPCHNACHSPFLENSSYLLVTGLYLIHIDPLYLVFHGIINHILHQHDATRGCMAHKPQPPWQSCQPQSFLPGGAEEPSPQTHLLCTFESKKSLRLRLLELMNAECG